MKKRLLLKLGLVALLGTGLFVAWLWWMEPTTGICRATANRIRPGMTLAEVVAIIGEKPNDIGENSFGNFERHPSLSRSDRNAALALFRSHSLIGVEMRFWADKPGLIQVAFDENDCVSFSYYISHNESILDKLRRWLRLN